MLTSEEVHVERVMNKIMLITGYSLPFTILLMLHSSVEIPGSVWQYMESAGYDSFGVHLGLYFSHNIALDSVNKLTLFSLA